MRELIIRFIEDGEVFNEIDEGRNYFLSEAESIVDKIKVRLTNEKRVASPKGFECLVDGKKIIIASVRFENEKPLEEQLKETIQKHKEWSDEIKNKYINKIEEYVKRERELMAHKEFKAFVIRFDQYMANPKKEPFPLLISIEKMKELFDGVLVNTEFGFYSKLEEIMFAIDEAVQIIVNQIYNDLSSVDLDEHEGDMADFLNVRTLTWLNEEENFKRFKNYVVSRYNSIPKSRIRAIYPSYELFQAIQDEIFTNVVKKYDFNKAYSLNKEMISRFYKKYDEILFEGFSLKDDEMITSLVLSPVVKEYMGVVENMLKGGSEENRSKGMNEYGEKEHKGNNV